MEKPNLTRAKEGRSLDLQMKSGPPRPPSLSMWLTNLLAEQIIEGDLPGGCRLLEAEIATRYGLSRAPVREALRILEGDGLVQILPRHGAVVRYVTRQEVSDLYTCRVAIEGLAARLVATRITEEELAVLRLLRAEMKQLSEEGKFREHFHLTLRFHAIWQEACGNPTLLELIHKMNARVQRFRFLLIIQPGRIPRARAAGDALIAAFEARDPDLAEQTQREIILEALDELLASNVLPEDTDISAQRSDDQLSQATGARVLLQNETGLQRNASNGRNVRTKDRHPQS